MRYGSADQLKRCEGNAYEERERGTGWYAMADAVRTARDDGGVFQE